MSSISVLKNKRKWWKPKETRKKSERWTFGERPFHRVRTTTEKALPPLLLTTLPLGREVGDLKDYFKRQVDSYKQMFKDTLTPGLGRAWKVRTSSFNWVQILTATSIAGSGLLLSVPFSYVGHCDKSRPKVSSKLNLLLQCSVKQLGTVCIKSTKIWGVKNWLQVPNAGYMLGIPQTVQQLISSLLKSRQNNIYAIF